MTPYSHNYVKLSNRDPLHALVPPDGIDFAFSPLHHP